MGDYILDGGSQVSAPTSTDAYDTWTAEQLADYFRKHGLGEYGECLIKHKITGKLAPLLTDLDLKEMGISCIGDRLRFRAHLHKLKRKVRDEMRNRCLWEGEEELYFSTAEEMLLTCFRLCPDDPSTYKLTDNYLKIKNVNPARCGPIRLCCCHEYSLKNVDLTNVTDVDVLGVPSPCIQRVLCCAPGKDQVLVASRGMSGIEQEADVLPLIVTGGMGDSVATMIMNSVEETQMIERD